MYRVAAAFDVAWFRIVWISLCGGMVAATWSSGAMGRWLVASACGLSVAATLPVFTAHGVRRVRLLAGATSITAGTILTMQLSIMLEHPDVEDPSGLTGAIFFALCFAVAAGWIADERVARASDEAARCRADLDAARHAELMAATGAHSGARFRLRDALLLSLALVLARRRP